jgi:UDP-N-acetylmuramate dehydrogenase
MREITERFLSALPERLREHARRDEPMAAHTSLRVGGPADLLLRVARADDLALAAAAAQRFELPTFLLGGGTNICVSDRGVRGLVLLNACEAVVVGPETRAETGVAIMRLFQVTASAGLSGLEFAVGIPGTLGGALVSNAGAYRRNICDLVTGLDVVECGERRSVGPEWMGFAYRDSRLRRPGALPAVVVSATLRLEPSTHREVVARAREYQRQRVFRQPWLPSAGSFFKNVYSRELADSLSDLPDSMREAGVVPAGFLSAACDCKGLAVGGARVSRRHANFIVNAGGATASDIRTLAGYVRARVRERFGVELQEEVLYVGEWDEAACAARAVAAGDASPVGSA